MEDPMNHKPAVLSLAEKMISTVARTEQAIPATALDAPSSWETWNAADALYHCAAWLEKDLHRLHNPGEIIPIFDSEELEKVNREIYLRHRGRTWADAKAELERIVGDIIAKIESMSEGELNQTLKYRDGRTRPLWWGVAGHLGLHVAWHLGMVLRRAGRIELSVSVTEDIVAESQVLSDDARWLAANRYDLAVAYAQAGRAEDALRELAESFRLNPGIREFAPEDDDLEPLWENDDFRRLCAE
jgi:hypothetical protein